MKVLLINPSWESAKAGSRRYHRAWPPLDLLTAAALLRRGGHSPDLIDARATDVSVAEMQARAESADMVVLQSTPLDRWQCPDLDWQRLAGLARKFSPDKMVLAGAHGTVRPDLMLEATEAACLIRGEPETAIAALAASGIRPDDIPGVSYRRNGTTIHNPIAPPTALDDLPAPAYDLIDPADYRYELLGPRLALVETSRGCPYSCVFCLKAMYGPGIRHKSIDRVLAELDELIGRRGAQSVYFIDLEFTLNRDYTVTLCREIQGMGLDFHWCCQTRADTVDFELLRIMKDSGCRLIHFGVETGSPSLLNAIKKKVSLDQIRSAIRACHTLGMATACFFLFGLPGETSADRRATIRLARELNPTFASFHVAAPYPGTLMGAGPDSAEPFPACLHAEHDLAGLAKQARRAFMGFYMRPAYVAHQLRQGDWRDKIGRLKLFWEFIR